MHVIRFLYFIPTIVEVVKSSVEADNGSLLTKTQSLSELKHLLRGSGSNVGKETGNKEETSSVNQSAKRMLEAGIKRLVQLKSINDDCCNDDDESDDNNVFVPSDGSDDDRFGGSCAMADDLVVVGAPGVDGWTGAAYLFHLNGTEVKKLTPGGVSVSIDEKIVVGSHGNYIRVFSRNGIYERTIRCDDCSEFGPNVATYANKIVTRGIQNSTEKLFIYPTEDGQLMKVLEQGSNSIYDVAMSEQFIVSTARFGGKTFIYNNTSPDFPKIAEIEQGGETVAVAGDRVVIDDSYGDGGGGDAYLYKTDGTLVTALDRQDASNESLFGSPEFGGSVAINDDKVIVGAGGDDDQGEYSGSVFIYSADTGQRVCI